MYSKAHSQIVDLEKDWTIRELNFAQDKGKRIVFINIDKSQLTDIFRFDYAMKQRVDGTSKEDLKRLVSDLRGWLRISYIPKPTKERRLNIIVVCTIFVFALISLWGIYIWNKTNDTDINAPSIEEPQNREEAKEIDDERYYTSSFNDQDLFIKGLKYGKIVWDPFCQEGNDVIYAPEKMNKDHSYIYKCGRVFAVKLITSQTTYYDFKVTDESNVETLLDYNFGDIGTESVDSTYGNYIREGEYPGNRILIGQYDLDGDKIDELIIGLQCTAITYDNVGIAMNVFSIKTGKWELIGMVNCWSNELPAIGKFIGANFYVHTMRYDEKYTFYQQAFHYDESGTDVIDKADLLDKNGRTYYINTPVPDIDDKQGPFHMLTY